jgi:hypothetical protein
VRGVVQIMDNDGAGFESHDGNLSYSSFVRPWALAVDFPARTVRLRRQGPIKPAGIALLCNKTPFLGVFRCIDRLIRDQKTAILFIKTPSFGGFHYRE